VSGSEAKSQKRKKDRDQDQMSDVRFVLYFVDIFVWCVVFLVFGLPSPSPLTDGSVSPRNAKKRNKKNPRKNRFWMFC
jgi:hypothetical protein